MFIWFRRWSSRYLFPESRVSPQYWTSPLVFLGHSYRSHLLLSFTFSVLHCSVMVPSYPSLLSTSPKSSLIVCTDPSVTTIPFPVHALSSCSQICFCVSWLKVTEDSVGQTLEATSILRHFAHFPAFWSVRSCWIGIFSLEGLDFWLRSLPFPLSFQPADITFCFKTLRNFQDQNMAGAESSRKLSCSNKAGLPGWKIFHRFFFPASVNQHSNQKVFWEF